MSRDDAPPRWVRAVVALLMLGVAVTAVPLAGNLTTQLRHGVNRPYARPLPPDLRDAIRARVAQTPGVEILLMAESAIEHGFGVEVVLLTRAASDDRLVADLHDLIRRELGDDAPARVLTVRAAD